MLTKKLTAIGNSYGIIIEKPILELLGFDKESVLKVSTDGRRLIIEQEVGDVDERVRAATMRVMDDFDETLTKLSQGGAMRQRDRIFLTREQVEGIHDAQIARYGGSSGLRDEGLLESALAQPGVSFGGVFVHDTLFAMAAAYLFHIARNHPFVDGNKRTALVSALVFLEVNGVVVRHGAEVLYQLTLNVAEGKVDKAYAGAVLRSLAEAS